MSYTSVGSSNIISLKPAYTQQPSLVWDQGSNTLKVFSRDEEEKADQDRCPRVYLASKFEDYERQKRLRDYLWEKHAIVVTARWIRGGHDPNGNTPEEAMKYASEDLADIRAADMVVLWNPKSFHGSGRGGRHVELGYALALEKPVILVGSPENVFYYLPYIVEIPDPESGAIVASSDPGTTTTKVDEAYCFEIIAQAIKAQFFKST